MEKYFEHAAHLAGYDEERRAVANLEVCEVLNRIANGYHIADDEHMMKYLTICITDKLRESDYNQHILRVPSRTVRHKGWVEFPKRTDLSEIGVTDSTLIDTIELIDLAVKTTRDREVVDLRLLGYNDVEISEKLGTNPTEIRRVRKNVEERFNAIF